MATKPINLRIDEKVDEEIEKFSKKNAVTKTDIITIAVREYIEAKNSQYYSIPITLKEMKAIDRFIGDENKEDYDVSAFHCRDDRKILAVTYKKKETQMEYGESAQKIFILEEGEVVYSVKFDVFSLQSLLETFLKDDKTHHIHKVIFEDYPFVGKKEISEIISKLKNEEEIKVLIEGNSMMGEIEDREIIKDFLKTTLKTDYLMIFNDIDGYHLFDKNGVINGLIKGISEGISKHNAINEKGGYINAKTTREGIVFYNKKRSEILDLIRKVIEENDTAKFTKKNVYILRSGTLAEQLINLYKQNNTPYKQIFFGKRNGFSTKLFSEYNADNKLKIINNFVNICMTCFTDEQTFFKNMNEMLIRRSLTVVLTLKGEDATIDDIYDLMTNTSNKGKEMVKTFLMTADSDDVRTTQYNNSIAEWFLSDYYTGLTGERSATLTYEQCSGARYLFEQLLVEKEVVNIFKKVDELPTLEDILSGKEDLIISMNEEEVNSNVVEVYGKILVDEIIRYYNKNSNISFYDESHDRPTENTFVLQNISKNPSKLMCNLFMDGDLHNWGIIDFENDRAFSEKEQECLCCLKHKVY